MVDQYEAELICESCIIRLKDASLFYQQVLTAKQRVIQGNGKYNCVSSYNILYGCLFHICIFKGFEVFV